MRNLFLLLILFFSVNSIAAEFNLPNYETETLDGMNDVYAYDITNKGFKYRTQSSTLLVLGIDYITIKVYNECTGNLIYSEHKETGASFGEVSIPSFQTLCSWTTNTYYTHIEYNIQGAYGNVYFGI